MTKPRQEFLGPITKLAAINVDGSWISDGYGIVDGYGAEIYNVSMVINDIGDLHLGGSSVQIETAVRQNTIFSYDESTSESKFVCQGRIEILDEGAFNQGNSLDTNVLQCADNSFVAISESGYGSYTLSPKAYDNMSTQIPRVEKYFGTFNLNGSSSTKTLSFSTRIHNYTMPANTILVGTFMIGWMGNGSYSAGGAAKFLFTITSDSSGDINLLYCSISDNHGSPGATTSLTSPGSDPSPANGDSMWVLPSGSNLPLISVSIPSSPTTTFAFVIQATENGAPSDFARFFWDIEYSWGANT